MNSFTIGYVCFQAVVLLVVLFILWKKKGWYAHTNTAASILTIVGVLGTFIGIFIGLQEFTISDASKEMQNSISELLVGLKFAFLTSIIGIGSALILKGIISPLFKQFQNGGDPDENAMEKFINGLKIALEPGVIPIKLDGLTEAIKGESIETRKVLDSIKTELIGEQKEQGEQTRKTLTEMQSEIIREQTNIFKHLETLTTTVSEKQSELQIGIENALTPIQTSLIDEQTGVLTKLETLTATVSDEHGKLRTEFETFSNNVSESITKLATDELVGALKTVIDEFNTNMVSQFGDNFRHLNEAVERMVKWQKEHRENMEKLTEKFHVATESIEKSRVSLENIVNSSSAIVERSDSIVACAEKLEPILNTMNGQLETFSELRQKAEDSLPVINENIEKLTTQFSSKVEEVIDASKASMETQRTALERQSEQLEKDLRQNVEDIRDGLEKALTESLNGLVGQLTSLSHQFVEDYEPLTIQLQRLVDMARNVEVERNREGVR